MPDHTSDSWGPSPEKIELTRSEIHVWRAYVDREEIAVHQLEATLSMDEKARANRFSFEKDRNSYIGSRGVLRALLGKYLGRSPESLDFGYNPRGKPFLLGNSLDSPVEFNVSHSHGVALLAFTIGRQLGIDVELVRPDIANEEIAERYFSSQEVVELRALPPPLRAEGFFLCWTRKEAYIKARGEGLLIPLTSFTVGLTPGQPERLESTDSHQWTLRSFKPDTSFVGALVGEGTGWRMRSWDWSPQT